MKILGGIMNALCHKFKRKKPVSDLQTIKESTLPKRLSDPETMEQLIINFDKRCKSFNDLTRLLQNNSNPTLIAEIEKLMGDIEMSYGLLSLANSKEKYLESQENYKDFAEKKTSIQFTLESKKRKNLTK